MPRNRKVPRRFVVWGLVRRSSLSAAKKAGTRKLGQMPGPYGTQSRCYGTQSRCYGTQSRCYGTKAASSLITGLASVISSAARFSSCSEIACSESVKSL
jgi:hypothetical protein